MTEEFRERLHREKLLRIQEIVDGCIECSENDATKAGEYCEECQIKIGSLFDERIPIKKLRKGGCLPKQESIKEPERLPDLLDCGVWVSYHCQDRFKERIDPCANMEDIKAYFRKSHYVGRMRKKPALVYEYKHIRFIVKRNGFNKLKIVTVYHKPLI